MPHGCGMRYWAGPGACLNHYTAHLNVMRLTECGIFLCWNSRSPFHGVSFMPDRPVTASDCPAVRVTAANLIRSVEPAVRLLRFSRVRGDFWCPMPQSISILLFRSAMFPVTELPAARGFARDCLTKPPSSASGAEMVLCFAATISQAGLPEGFH